MANKLKDMELPSVDLCKRGANPHADIKLFKSAPEEGGESVEESSVMKKIAKAVASILRGEELEEQPITKAASVADVRETTEALRKSFESIIADDSLSAVEKHDMMAESLQQFTLEATDLMDGWAAAIGKAGEEDEEPDEDHETDDFEEEEEDEEPGDEPEDVEKGVFDMATIQIEKMSPEDRATLEALEKKYTETAHQEPTAGGNIHPDVQKAIDEVAELRKSLEIKELEGVAKKYEVIGKKADELAPKLYELKKAGEQHYNDFVALLDEQVQMQQTSGIFKELGSSRGTPSDLDGTVAELRKADPSLTREAAICKAFETNPNLDPFTGKLRA